MGISVLGQVLGKVVLGNSEGNSGVLCIMMRLT